MAVSDLDSAKQTAEGRAACGHSIPWGRAGYGSRARQLCVAAALGGCPWLCAVAARAGNDSQPSGPNAAFKVLASRPPKLVLASQAEHAVSPRALSCSQRQLKFQAAVQDGRRLHEAESEALRVELLAN